MSPANMDYHWNCFRLVREKKQYRNRAREGERERARLCERERERERKREIASARERYILAFQKTDLFN